MEGRYKVRVRYGETDCMGRVHHRNYLSYFELARVELMRECGFSYAKVESEDGCYLPVFKTGLTYRAPARFDDELEIHASVADFSYVRLTFQYDVRRLHDSVLCAEGYTVLAAVDHQGEPRKLPADLLEYLQGLPLPPESERRKMRVRAGGNR